MEQVDIFKLCETIQDSISKLDFLDLINKQADDNSELQGFEISKLLTEQRKLESKYAELINIRTTLVGIANKNKLKDLQLEIKDVSKNLKESTRKLCRLFKENPDLEGDQIKVSRDRKNLIFELKDLKFSIEQKTMAQTNEKILDQLGDQDQFRKLTQKEKELNQDIKKINLDKAQEKQEYEQEHLEKQKTIQKLKDDLTYKQQVAKVQWKYDEKQAKAELGTKQRIFDYNEKKIEDEIQQTKEKIHTEVLVHKELVNFLNQKILQLEEETQKWSKIAENLDKEQKEKIEKLQQEKQKLFDQLVELRKRFSSEEEAKRQSEELEKRKMNEKKKEQQDQILLDNAIKLIQMEYLAFKERGGGGKKKKMSKKK